MPTAPGATIVHLNLTQITYARYRALADNSGMSVRQYISSLLLRHAATTVPKTVRIVIEEPCAFPMLMRMPMPQGGL